MMAEAEQTDPRGETRVTAQPGLPAADAQYPETVLKMPRHLAIVLVEAPELDRYAWFSLLAGILASVSATFWAGAATAESNGWVIAAAAVFTVMTLVFLVIACVAWHGMKKESIEIPLLGEGGLLDMIRKKKASESSGR